MPPAAGAPAAVGVAAALLGAAVLVGACGGRGEPGSARPSSAPPVGTPAPMPVATPVLHRLDAGAVPAAPGPAGTAGVAPARLRIPRIGVDSTLARLGLGADGTIEAPPDFGQAGWYTKGPAPGDLGPAVILGHLDSATGPAVFARLPALRAGDEMLVVRDDGSEVRFVVQRVATFPVDAFPTDEVYGATSEPALRLITCGGTFSLARGRYLENVVVFARLA